MLIDSTLLDNLTEEARRSPRLRMNYDLRNSSGDGSQRMLNAMEPGTLIPVHRHTKSSETVVVMVGLMVKATTNQKRMATPTESTFMKRLSSISR